VTGAVAIGGGADAGTTDGELRRELASRIGSRREAAWIVDHAERARGLEGAARDEAARRLAARRAAGEPLQYVLGRWPFRVLDLDVDRRVLIPRPETEHVVEVALGRLARLLQRADRPPGPAVCVDLGTGSGAIALSLAAEEPGGRAGTVVFATDRSAAALEVARANRDRLAAAGALGSARVQLVDGHWFDALPSDLVGIVDLVVANPPYVSAEEFEHLDPVVRDHEPVDALVAGAGSDGTPGLADVEAVLREAPRWLRPGGAVVVEIAPHQAEAARTVALGAGFRDVAVVPDLSDRPRMVVAGC
jgi:release factor glutamine methyltransferase